MDDHKPLIEQLDRELAGAEIHRIRKSSLRGCAAIELKDGRCVIVSLERPSLLVHDEGAREARRAWRAWRAWGL